MYHKSTDFWCIGAGKQGFEVKKLFERGRYWKFLLIFERFSCKSKVYLIILVYVLYRWLNR